MELRENIYVPFALSILIHSFLVFFLVSSALRMPLPVPDPIQVEVIEPETSPRVVPPPAPAAPPPSGAAAPAEVEPPTVARPKNQIVSPPDSPEAEPDQARFLSDRNSRTEEETVKRGQPAPPAEPPRLAAREKGPSSESPGRRGDPAKEPEAKPADRVAKSDRPEIAPLPGLADLFARPSDVIRDPKIGGGTLGEGEAGEGSRLRDLAKHTRPDLWASPGERGTLDYLPEIRQGKFTLLNTKADLFAPFVRRVGMRIFQSFSMDFKRRIFGGDVPQGKERLEIEAVMSKDGRRLTVNLKKRSGNLSADRTLLATLSDEIFFDENPPPGAAAADGRIHFVFALDAAVWFQATEQGMQPGAQWVFGAGLL
jgi:hypothetical protein